MFSLLEIEELLKIKSELSNPDSTWYLTRIEMKDHLELTLRKLLWNELELTDIDFKQTILFYGFHQYLHHRIDMVDYKVLWTLFVREEMISSKDVVVLFFLLADDQQLSSLESFVDYIYEDINRFGPLLPQLTDIVTYFEAFMHSGVQGEYDQILGKLSSIHKRPEYLQAIIENTGTDDLVEIEKWTDWQYRGDITSEIISRKVEELDFTSYPNLQTSMVNDPYLIDFPVSLEVFGANLSTLQPNTLDMSLLEKLHPQLVQTWAPKFVYSSPELSNDIRIYFPGGKHIGHSAILIKTAQSLLLLDFGLSVVNNSLPKWLPQLEKLDAVLISHAHLDHSGSLPLLMGKKRKLPWLASSETKIMTEMLWYDTLNILGRNYSNEYLKDNSVLRALSNKSNLLNTLSNFHEIETEKTLQLLPDVEITAHSASHLFGSMGFELSIGNKRILYTGDFNADGTPSFEGAKFPTDCDVTIFDGTYYGRYVDYPTPEETLQNVLNTSKRILVPSFSMGRAQEMLFQLKKLGADKNWKIFLTGMGGRLAREMNMTVGKSGGGRSSGVSIVPSVTEDEFGDNCIVISGQGMLQVGTSRNLLEATKEDPNTSVVLCGYQAPNTMGFHLLNHNRYLMEKYHQRVFRVKMSGHTTGETLDQFIDSLVNPKIMVHSPVGAFEHKPNSEILIPDVRNPIEL